MRRITSDNADTELVQGSPEEFDFLSALNDRENEKRNSTHMIRNFDDIQN